MFLVYNSDVLPETDFRLPATDRAFQYGDGLFETVRYENGILWFWPAHFERLSAGMAALRLRPPAGFSSDAVRQAIEQLLLVNNLHGQCARIKIQVWRQAGGLYTPATNDANILVTARSGTPFLITEKAKIGICDTIHLAQSAVSGFKTLSALPYILAGLYKQDNDLDDVILLNTDPEHYVAECLASNLFWFDEGVLYTPALETGCVAGILRGQLLRIAERIGLPTNVGFHDRQSLMYAEAVFCCNVNGIQWLRQIDGIGTYPAAHPLAERLFAQLKTEN